MKNDIILVIAAHPDDEVLGCGGTIARLSDEGNKVYISIFGEGITSRYDSRNLSDKKLLDKLRNHSKEASLILGAQDLIMYDLPDNRFDTVPLLKIVKMIEELILKIKPNIIFTHGSYDLNIDHTILNRAVLTASRPISTHVVREIYTFEIPSSTEWSFNQIGKPFSPNYFVDINKTLDKKLEAMKKYKSEIRNFPHPRSTKALRAIAQRWGSCAGFNAAEAFQLVRFML